MAASADRVRRGGPRSALSAPRPLAALIERTPRRINADRNGRLRIGRQATENATQFERRVGIARDPSRVDMIAACGDGVERATTLYLHVDANENARGSQTLLTEFCVSAAA